MTDDELQQAMKELRGTWPEHCPQRAFVNGVKWWHFEQTMETLYGFEVDQAIEKAVEIYGQPVLTTADELIERAAGQ